MTDAAPARPALPDDATVDRRDIRALLRVMARLRDPESGCPWDVAQDFSTIAPYTIEEAYEVADAIDRGSMADLVDELGDLLLQVVFHARMAEEAGAFAFPDVVEAIVTKMIRRHPHVFAEDGGADQDAVRRRWEDIKAEERAAKAARADAAPATAPSLLDDVGQAMPALMRAAKLGKRAARIGFDWPDARSVLDKVAEETAELREAMDAGHHDAVREEVGDLLFSVAQLARKLHLDPEDALRRADAKFERRFRALETRLTAEEGTAEEGDGPVDADRLEALWQAVKASEAEAARTPEDLPGPDKETT
ncbi:MAG: nucleoside triphosphate pyrophosphohydrolase [Tistrella sp.]|nr:nucleoside triphosphate pyrophosphohydrolase [Tistrella sp.]MAD35849.1 nucleoside triphosphate pyrophosphohydrolase [Tistrella sp.]MBA78151.1 nucleoside triphosphate pyrophosphohydrolase [Tistrella sp.]